MSFLNFFRRMKDAFVVQRIKNPKGEIISYDGLEYTKIYEGPLTTTIKKLKVVSLCSGSASLFLFPFIYPHGENEMQKISWKNLTAFGCLTFGVATTVLLQLLISGYTLRIHFNSKKHLSILQFYTFFGLTKYVYCAPRDILVFDGLIRNMAIGPIKFFVHKELPETQKFIHFIETTKKAYNDSIIS